jgi:arylsulfatase A-like enzyme
MPHKIRINRLTARSLQLSSCKTQDRIAQMNEAVSTQRRTAASNILLTAIWVGLLVGLAEVSVRAVQVFVVHQWIWLSPDVVWMAPLADVSLLGIAACVLLLGGRRWPRLASCWSVLFVFTFLGLLGPILFIPRLDRYAALLLACGLAAQLARIIVVRFDALQLLVRKTTFPFAIIVLALSLSVTGWRMFETRTAVAHLAPAPAGAPNVLLIVLDTVRAKSLSLYGYNRGTTPQLEQLAKAGVVFERALSTSSWTLPAHATMFTGRYPRELSADWLTPLDGTYPTLAEVFGSHGYVTAGFVANLLYCTYETGLARGFVHYEDYPVSLGMIVRSSWLARTMAEGILNMIGSRRELVRKTAEDVNEDFLDWLSQNHGRPFFAFLNYMDAHAPYLPPKPFDIMFGPQRARPDVSVRRTWSAQEIQVEQDAYDGSIAYLDHQLGLLFGELQKRGLLGNTLVVITSDHGEQFGEHGLFDHGNSLYRPLLHVPLVISFPSRLPASERVREPVTLRDLPATISDIIKLPGGPRFPGKSLARYWEKVSDVNQPATPLLSAVSKAINMPDWLPVMKGDMTSLIANGFHYIRNGDGREELYDFDKDPAEKNDLAASDQYRQALERMRESLESSLRTDQLIVKRLGPRNRK